MKNFTRPLFFMCLLLASSFANADDKSDCSAGQGTFLIGEVVTGPTFSHGQFLKGIELSHTHLKVKVDGPRNL
ncbi:hypothetical protein [Undibacterium terreum]|uniref:hypothetical protein n=1 Tax=Undibacterium terreum TaxID=1224302 RepID=UPI001E523BEA|nr:hypothetical protein [Undibacterium terreum]